MKVFFGASPIISQFMELKWYWLPIFLAIILSYSTYYIFDDHVVAELGYEDNLFENLTAIFFLVASGLFLRTFIKKKNYWFLLLAIIFFVGFGEEITWGQRILQIETPAWLARINVQKEISIHNIELFNGHYFDHSSKSGISKLLCVNFVYKLFWLSYCILLPIASLCWNKIASLVAKFRLPLPNIFIGMFFLVSWLTYKGILVFLLPPGKTKFYYGSIYEMNECISSLIFMVIAIYFTLQKPMQKTND